MTMQDGMPLPIKQMKNKFKDKGYQHVDVPEVNQCKMLAENCIP